MAYDVAVGVARAAAPLAGMSSKLARSVRGRGEAATRIAAWTPNRDPTSPLLWLHAASVGEGLQGRAVLSELRRLRPRLQVVFTHTSPSAEALARSLDVDVADYLPWDGGRAFRALFFRLQPSLVAFTQREVWPGLVRAAGEAGVPSVLVAATLPPAAHRLKRPGRWLLRPTFQRLAEVLAIADGDAERFTKLGVPRERVAVTGDPAIDSAWDRAAAADPGAPHLAPLLGLPAPTLVAGSTWPADERALISAIGWVREAVPSLRVVVVPHEPTEERVGRLVRELCDRAWNTLRLSTVVREGSLGGASALVVDSVGFLADLYTAGTVAFVGGAFDETGIHSVLEPAAVGLPVAFGPHYGGSRAAAELIRVGGARAAPDANGLAVVLESWLADPRALSSAGRAAKAYVDSHRGAAKRSAEALERRLDLEAPAGRWNEGGSGA